MNEHRDSALNHNLSRTAAYNEVVVLRAYVKDILFNLIPPDLVPLANTELRTQYLTPKLGVRNFPIIFNNTIKTTETVVHCHPARQHI